MQLAKAFELIDTTLGIFNSVNFSQPLKESFSIDVIESGISIFCKFLHSKTFFHLLMLFHQEVRYVLMNCISKTPFPIDFNVLGNFTSINAEFSKQ